MTQIHSITCTTNESDILCNNSVLYITSHQCAKESDSHKIHDNTLVDNWIISVDKRQQKQQDSTCIENRL